MANEQSRDELVKLLDSEFCFSEGLAGQILDVLETRLMFARRAPEPQGREFWIYGGAAHPNRDFFKTIGIQEAYDCAMLVREVTKPRAATASDWRKAFPMITQEELAIVMNPQWTPEHPPKSDFDGQCPHCDEMRATRYTMQQHIDAAHPPKSEEETPSRASAGDEKEKPKPVREWWIGFSGDPARDKRRTMRTVSGEPFEPFDFNEEIIHVREVVKEETPSQASPSGGLKEALIRNLPRRPSCPDCGLESLTGNVHLANCLQMRAEVSATQNLTKTSATPRVNEETPSPLLPSDDEIKEEILKYYPDEDPDVECLTVKEMRYACEQVVLWLIDRMGLDDHRHTRDLALKHTAEGESITFTEKEWNSRCREVTKLIERIAELESRRK